MGRMKRWSLILLLLAGLAGLSLAEGRPRRVLAQEPEDPLVLGAWLWEGNCVRCHGPYKRERVGKDTRAEELEAAIEDDGCKISWGREHGGPLKSREIKAVAAYILAWEEAGGPPDLPELPPQPTPTPSPTPTLSTGPAATPTPTPAPDPMTDRVRLIVAASEVAWGAWLYTQNCYRCHLGYEEARQGASLSLDRVKDAIENGKIGTQMDPFSRKKGGQLKSREIEAIVLYIQAWEMLDAQPALAEGLLIPPTPDPAAFEPVALPEIPLIEGDAGRGASLYALYCRQCHGVEGQGRIGPALFKTWPSVRPDLRVRSTIAQGAPGSLMPAWGQASGGPLPEQDIHDLTAFVLSRAVPSQPAVTAITGPVTQAGLWQGPLGLLALLAGSLLFVFIAFSTAPRGRNGGTISEEGGDERQ